MDIILLFIGHSLFSSGRFNDENRQTKAIVACIFLRGVRMCQFCMNPFVK